MSTFTNKAAGSTGGNSGIDLATVQEFSRQTTIDEPAAPRRRQPTRSCPGTSRRWRRRPPASTWRYTGRSPRDWTGDSSGSARTRSGRSIRSASTGSSAPAWRTGCGCGAAAPSGIAAGSCSTRRPPRRSAAPRSPARAPAVATASSIPTSPPQPASSTLWSRPAACRSSSTSGLESVARSDFGGTLEAGFAAHPRYDPATGMQHAIVYEPGLPVRYLTLDGAGRATTVARIDLPHTPMIHDVAFTASSIVVLDLPVTFQPEAAIGPALGRADGLALALG